MKKFVVIVVFLMLGSTSAVLEAQQSYADIDQEMVMELALNQEQARAYIAIMRKQRQAFFALKARDWQRELALYRETFAMLKPVLTEKQHAQFVGIINSVIEDTQEEEFLAMDDQGCATAVCEY